MGYSILIVDDEQLIRQGIRARLDYLGFEFSSIKEAMDGESALEVIDEDKIDIVITDIRMGDIDGLEMIRRAKQTAPHIQFIILSGYAEFAYAEQAITLGVQAYLSKPVSNDQLKKALESAITGLEQAKKQNESLKIGRRILKENQQYVLEKDLNAMLHQEDTLGMEAPLLTKNDKYLMVAIIHIDGDSYGKNKFGYQDIDIIRFSIQNIFNETSIESSKIIINNLSNSNQLFAILSSPSKDILQAEAEQLFSMVQGVLWNQMHISTSIGVSSVTNNLSLAATNQAKKAFQQRLIHGNGNIYFYENIPLMELKEFPTKELNLLGQYIERNDIGNIQFIINSIFSDERVKNYNMRYIRMIWIRVTSILLKHTNTSMVKDPDKIEKLIADVDEVEKFNSLDELREYLWFLISNCLDVDMDMSGKDKIQLAINFIIERYNEDISINDLAERLEISPNYFSSLFKKETGKSTISYIKELRVEKAKEYLVNTDHPVVQIAKDIGYEDSQYFFKIFKKETGLTPLQYRKDYK